jgi:hypothetical protein
MLAMLKPGDLSKAFKTYWDDMKKCRRVKAYWSLLHVTVCIPDICSALESNDGWSSGPRYIDWCDQWSNDPVSSVQVKLSGIDRYVIRCNVLHQGRASGGAKRLSSQYSEFCFDRPSNSNESDHMRVDGSTLHLDVGKLAEAAKNAVERWTESLEANPRTPKACNVEKHLKSLVKVTRTKVKKLRPDGITQSYLRITTSSQ